MTRLIRCAVIAGVLVTAATGCGDDTTTPGTDASTGGGLVVMWSSDPSTWPGDLGDGVTVERAVFALDNLRIIGDAAPGDPRTSAGELELRWDDSSQPADLGFPDAPGGVYSQLSLLIDGRVAGASIEVRGHASVNGTDYEYRIVDDSPFAVTLSMNVSLQPPAATTLELLVDFEHTLDALDFSVFDVDNGRLVLENGDPQMDLFRVKLMESFTVAN